MPAGIRHFIRSVFEPQATVLMYHRVASFTGDPWEICVSPENFEAQLQLLQQTGNVIPLAEMAENLQKKRIKRNSIAITFDDGYADNYVHAKPLLEKYGLPATFFITTAQTGKKTEFWWDELENLILNAEQLPAVYAGNINGISLRFELADEAILQPKQQQVNQNWRACTEAPPSIRCAMFLKIWQILKPLAPEIQQQELQKLRAWAGVPTVFRQHDSSMTESQLREVSNNPLFEIGAHTVSHVALAAHPPEFQEQELQQSRNALHEITGKAIRYLSYPYGNYNEATLNITGRTGFQAAFTTEPQPLTKQTAMFRAGRLQVTDLGGADFQKHILENHIRN